MSIPKVVSIVLLLWVWQGEECWAQRKGKFSVFSQLSEDDSRKLSVVLGYPAQGKAQEKLAPVIVKKWRVIRKIVGSPSKPASPLSKNQASFLSAKRNQAYSIYLANQSLYQKDLVQCAESVSVLDAPEAKNIAACLLIWL